MPGIVLETENIKQSQWVRRQKKKKKKILASCGIYTLEDNLKA